MARHRDDNLYQRQPKGIDNCVNMRNWKVKTIWRFISSLQANSGLVFAAQARTSSITPWLSSVPRRPIWQLLHWEDQHDSSQSWRNCSDVDSRAFYLPLFLLGVFPCYSSWDNFSDQSLPNKVITKGSHPNISAETGCCNSCPLYYSTLESSFSTGIFPEEMKLAFVTPILKKPDLDPEIEKPFSGLFHLLLNQQDVLYEISMQWFPSLPLGPNKGSFGFIITYPT